jgi:hypothetical protein
VSTLLQERTFQNSDEDEEWWVNTVRVEEEGENLEELEDSEPGEQGESR